MKTPSHIDILMSPGFRFLLFSCILARPALAGPPFEEFADPNPNPGNQFGHSVVPLSTGNVVITAPFDDAGGTDAGAVYLFNGANGALVSTLKGSTANDNVGSFGIVALTNGNFAVRSANWDNGAATNAGAVTFGNGTTGVSGEVSQDNSLVGSTANDLIGFGGVVASPNGSYVVVSTNWANGAAATAGAVTFSNGTTGVSGPVSSANSLVGSTTGDQVGNGGVMMLGNGNYVVVSTNWDGGAFNTGAVTFGNGNTGVSGAVSSANSLVGSAASDQVGSSGVVTLGNGSYVVVSTNWDNGAVINAGAVTFGNGTTGVSGTVSSANSLVGSAASDQVGSSGVVALTNANYVVRSPLWDHGAVTNVGAVTFGSGATGVSGTASSANSLVGSTANDGVGTTGVVALSNGNYVVRSSNWDNGTVANAGAATFGNGTTGVTGAVSSVNSLVGSAAGEQVGDSGVTALTNGNYVVASSSWDGTAFNLGAVTFGNGTTGVSGTVSPANSLVGSSGGSAVGSSGVVALTNGNYVVRSPLWDNGAVDSAGAVTFGNGTTGVTGVVSSANSLVGSATGDSIGFNSVVVLKNGNYVVVGGGGVTFGNGTTGTSGAISSANSLVGSSANDQVGGSVLPLANGNYVVVSSLWDNGAVANAGAVTFGNGTAGVSGVISSANSLVGSTAEDRLGFISELKNGNYVVVTPDWDNGAVANAGAVTFCNGTTGVSGVISSSNSLVGSTAGDRIGAVTALNNGNYVVVGSNWDRDTLPNAGSVTFCDGSTGLNGAVTTFSSALGQTANTALQSSIPDEVNGTFYARFLNDGSGKVRVGSMTSGFVPNGPEIVLFTGNNTLFANERADNAGSQAFGAQVVGNSSAAQTFTIQNLGANPLTGLTVSLAGANPGSYSVNTAGMSTTLASNTTTTFSVTFSAAGGLTGSRPASVLVASNDANENPFDINITGTALSRHSDTDSDGLNDASEFQMTALGFDWEASQVPLVGTLFNNIGGAQSNLNAVGFFTSSQVQAIHLPTPLIQRNLTTGVFTLTLGVEKSTTLQPGSFQPFSMSAPGTTTTINGAGKLEFQFTVPDNAAFFKIGAQ